MTSQDITYCTTIEDCPKNNTCQRAEHPKEGQHTYCTFCDARCQKERGCDFYLPKEKSKGKN